MPHMHTTSKRPFLRLFTSVVSLIPAYRETAIKGLRPKSPGTIHGSSQMFLGSTDVLQAATGDGLAASELSDGQRSLESPGGVWMPTLDVPPEVLQGCGLKVLKASGFRVLKGLGFRV